MNGSTNSQIMSMDVVTALAGKMDNTLTTGIGTVTNGCSLESSANQITWYKVGRMCTVIFAIRLSSAFTGQYTQYLMATDLPKSVIGIYPYNSQGLSVDGWTDTGGALAFVNTYGHLYILARQGVMADRVVVGSVTYITE